MPYLNILTWNSNGESDNKADCLRNLLQQLAQGQNPWVPDIIFIQEANAGQNGPIYNMLNGPGNYQGQVRRVNEGGASHNRDYLMAWSNRVTIVDPFQAASLAADPGVAQWINQTIGVNARQTFRDEINRARSLAFANVTVGGRDATVITWHAPREQSVIGLGTMPGGVSPDAYLALENSDFYGRWNAPGNGAVSVIAGDLNIRAANDGNNATVIDLGFGQEHELLEHWEGFHHRLDYVVARFGANTNGGVVQGNDYDCHSDHRIVTARVNW